MYLAKHGSCASGGSRQRAALIHQFVVLSGLIGTLVVSTAAWADDPPRVTAGRLRVELQRVVDRPPASDLNNPTIGMATAPDNSGRLFFVEKGGAPTFPTDARVQVFDGNAFSTFLDLTPEISRASENGFLGLAFHPGYADPLSPGYRKLYTYHSTPTDAGATVDFPTSFGVDHHNLVTEWQVSADDPDQVDVSTRREVFREAHHASEHNAGTITFGPDGYLYGGIGAPGGGSTARWLTAQNNADIFGTIYRIDPLDPSLTPSSLDAISANGKYRIPADNPFVNDPAALDEIYAYGLRNPYRFSLDPVTGLLFVGDVGQGSNEEVDVVPAGGNMGWPYREGTKNGPISTPDPPPVMVPPIAEYSHFDGKAIVGGFVYRGSIPALQGKYVFGDFSNNFWSGKGRLFFTEPFDAEGHLKDPADIRIREILTAPATCAKTLNANGACSFDSVLLSFGVDNDGELYAIGAKLGLALVYQFTDAYILPEGDYNEDGVVDAVDFTVWRDTLGQSVLVETNPMTFVGYGRKADGNGNGLVDDADYDVWKAHFGETIASGPGGASVSVPEPSSLLTMMVGIPWVVPYWTAVTLRVKNLRANVGFA